MTATRPPAQSISSGQVLGGRWLQSSLAEIGAVVRAWRRRYRYRRELARLISSGPHLIEDVGLLPEQAERERAKPFWRP
ncbi:MAG: hypothetical protein ACREIR_25425 [Geminicoccaceae bacterium]